MNFESSTFPRGRYALCAKPSFALGVLACVWLIPLSVRAEGAESDDVARILLTSQVAGQLARPRCDGDSMIGVTPFSRLTQTLVDARGAKDRPLIVDTGGLLAVDGLARFAARTNPEGLARLVVALGYRALAVGSNDLGLDRGVSIPLYRRLRAHGIPVLASNLRCLPEAKEFCDAVVDGEEGAAIFNVGKARVALLSVLPADTMKRVARDRTEGLWIEPAPEAIARLTRDARARGADVVVVTVDHGHRRGSASRTLELAESLPEAGRPDLLIAAGAGDELLFARPKSVQPAVAAGPPGGILEARVRRPELRQVYTVLAVPTPSSDREPATALTQWMKSVGPAYCRAWGDVFPGGHLESPIDGDGLLQLVAGTMRKVADAEIAVVNRGALNSRWKPARVHALTAGDVFMAFPYNDRLVVADVDAAWLGQLAERVDSASLLALGLENQNGTLKVAGRPINPDGTYRVVTLAFLGAGGDEALPEGAEFEPVDGVTLRRALREHLDRPRTVDPRDDLPDPAKSSAWTFRANTDANFAGSSITNPAGYDAAQLRRTSQVTLGIKIRLRADEDSPDWAWDNVGDASYRTVRNVGDPDPGFVEGDDLLSFRSTLVWQRLKTDLARFYIPDPYLDTYVESEFTVPPVRTWRHLLIRPTLGIRFSLTDELTVKFGAGFEREILDPAGTFHPGGGAQMLLKPWVLIQTGSRVFRLEGSLDYFITASGAGKFQTLRSNLDATYDLVGPLALVVGYKLFMQQAGSRELALAADFTAGVRMQWVDRVAGP